MIAHDIAGASFLPSVMVRRRTFFQEDSWIEDLTVILFVAPPDKSRGGAMSRGGSFDQPGAGLELREEWRMHHADEFSFWFFDAVSGWSGWSCMQCG